MIAKTVMLEIKWITITIVITFILVAFLIEMLC